MQEGKGILIKVSVSWSRWLVHYFVTNFAEAPFIENVLDDLKQFLENETIVAHNASFDMKFLLENFDRHAIDYKRYRVIDTLSLARQQISETPNHKLPTLKKFLNIEAESHDALADCAVTAKLYYYCKKAQE